MKRIIKRHRITWKLFLLTVSLLIIAVLSTVGFLYATLPSYYQSYREEQFHTTMLDIKNISQQTSSSELIATLDQLSDQGIRFSLWTESNQLFYAPGFERAPLRQARSFNANAPEGMIQESLTLDLTDQTLILDANQMIQPIDEVKSVILNLAPYIILPLLLLAVLAAFLYSRTISRPLLTLNQATRELAHLNFSVRTHHTSSDELGDLSRNINRLATKLESTMHSLQASNEQLRLESEKDRQRDTERRHLFLAISHELKTPLTIIKGQIEGMSLNLGAYKDRDYYLERAGQVIENMEALLAELLEVARVEQVALEEHDIDLHQMLQQQLHPLENFITERRLHVSMTGDAVSVRSDPSLLGRALHNLLMNAVSYTANAGTIQITTHLTDTETLLTITNQPTLHDTSETADWFDPLVRSEQSRNRIHGGSGLGLYLVHQIMERLGVAAHLHGTRNQVTVQIVFPKTS